MTGQDEILRFKSLIESDYDCECFDKSFEEFNKCCGKRFGIGNPVDLLFKMVADMSNKSDAPRLKDMEPDQAKKTLEKVFSILEKSEG